MRKARLLLGLTLFLLSCLLLIWGLWPMRRERLIWSVPPSELILPTPSGLVWSMV